MLRNVSVMNGLINCDIVFKKLSIFGGRITVILGKKKL
jgi:hypothetical protein